MIVTASFINDYVVSSLSALDVTQIIPIEDPAKTAAKVLRRLKKTE